MKKRSLRPPAALCVALLFAAGPGRALSQTWPHRFAHVTPRQGPVVNVAGGTLTVEGATSPYTVVANDTWDTVTVGDTGTGVLNQFGGTFTITNSSTGLNLGRTSATSNGTYNLSGGTLALGSVSLTVGQAGTGTFVQSGSSTVTAPGGALAVGGGSGSVGSYSLGGTGALTFNVLYVGFSSGGNNVYTQTGGTANVTGISYLGRNSSATKGTFNLSGGTFTTPSFVAGSFGTGIVNQTGGMLTVSGAGGLQVGSNGIGTYNLSAGTLAMGANQAIVGLGGTGSFVQNGTGAVTSTGVFSIGNNSGSVGSYSLADTATLSAATLYVGLNTSGNNVYAQSGGTATISGAAAVGSGVTSKGTFNLSGGTFSAASFSAGADGTGVVNQSGGTLTVTGTGGVQLSVTSPGNGTYNLNGGTLAARLVQRGAGTAAFNFNGGTLQATAASTAFMTGLQTANVQAGGARIDSNNNAITVGQPLAHDAALGATADGGLTKLGAGTLTLSGASTYTGPTTVSAGTLVLSPTGTVANTSAVVVTTGGTATLGAANRINPAASLTLDAASGPGAGATVAFNTGGFSQTLGPVTLNSTSVIDLASGASLLRLGNSVGNAWTGTLAIWNYTGTAVTGNGTDEVFFGTNTAGLTAAQVASIRFYSDGGTIPLAAAGYASLTGGEVVPGGLFPGTGLAVPEPATWALLGVGGGGLLGLTRRRRIVS